MTESMQATLTASIDKSLEWIYNHLDFFRLPDYDLWEEQFMDMHRKRFAELALLLSFLSKSDRWPGDHRARAIADFVATAAETSLTRFDLSRNLNLVPYYLVIRNGLLSIGKDIAGLQYKLQQIADAGFILQIERCVWNNIDLRYNLDGSGIKHTLPAYDAQYRSSSLFHFPGLPYIRENDCYAITHLIFYLSDFGSLDIRPMLQDKYEEVKYKVGLLLGYYAHKQEWDLVAELLMCCHMMDYRDFPLYDLCWELFMASQGPEGDFTSPYIQSRLGIEHLATEEERFQTNYHTTLVSVFASVTALHQLCAV